MSPRIFYSLIAFRYRVLKEVKRVHTVCPQGVSAQVPTRCDRGAPPSVSSTNRENPICIQHNPIRIPFARCPTICIQQNQSESLSESLCRPNVYPMWTQCRPKADPMPTQCRPWRHKLIKFAFSGKLWKGQNDVRFGPSETQIGSLKSSSRDLSNGTL